MTKKVLCYLQYTLIKTSTEIDYEERRTGNMSSYRSWRQYFIFAKRHLQSDCVARRLFSTGMGFFVHKAPIGWAVQKVIATLVDPHLLYHLHYPTLLGPQVKPVCRTQWYTNIIVHIPQRSVTPTEEIVPQLRPE